jgi:hypothetical protein
MIKQLFFFTILLFKIQIQAQSLNIVSSTGVTNPQNMVNGNIAYFNTATNAVLNKTYAMMVVELPESKQVYQMRFKTGTIFQFCPINCVISTANSPLGPWVSVPLGSCGITGLNDQYFDLLTDPVTRYLKVEFSNPSLPSNFTFEIDEIYVDGNENLINSNGIVLDGSSCFTLSALCSGEYYQWSTGATSQSINVCQPGTYSCAVTNVTFSGNQDHTESITIGSIGNQDNWATPNGEVYTIHRNGNTIYYGGDFNSAGYPSGSSAIIDGSSGNSNISFPRVFGTVNVTLPDGNGGWYIGGNFTRIGNYAIKNLAHINPNNTVDLNFKPEPNATVLTLILNGSYLYAGGFFTTIKGLTNNYIVKLDKYNGDPIFWNAFCNNVVRTMALYTDKIIVGGDFSSIGGLTRNRLATIDTNFVQATTWDPNPNAAVYKVFVNGTKLYVGGDFTNIAAVAKSRGAGFTLPGFTVDPYDFGANNRIHDFAFYNNVLYTAGTFTTIGGAARNYLAGLNPLNALANSFNATADGIVQTVAIYNGAVLAGGDFSNIGGAARNRLASLIPTSGLVNTWNPNVMGLKGTTYNLLAISSSGSSICAGGTFWGVGSSVRNNVASIDATTGSLLPFDPNTNNIVRSITSDATYVYLGGDFTTLNSTITKNRIAQVNATTGFPTGWNPNADASVNTMVINSGTLYAGGAFGNIGGGARSRIAGLSTTTGAANAYNPSANGNVNAFLISSDTLFVGGAFTTIGGQTRNRIAAYTMSNSALTAFDPNSNNTVNALAKNGSKLYLGGLFTTVGTTNVSILAQFDLITNSVTTLNTGITNSSGLNAVAVQDSSVYIGGGYQYTNCGLPIINSSVVKTLSNAPGHWMPQPDDIVRTIIVGPNKIFLGGRFKVVQSRYQPYFTTADLFFNGAAPTFSSTSSNSVCQGQSITVSGANLSSVTGVTINGISSPFVVGSGSSITVTPNIIVSGALVLNYPGGTINTNQNVTVNTPTTPSFNQVSAICSGSTLSPLPTTSTNNVSGTWSPALNNTATTTYTFTPSIGLCATTAPMTITVNPSTIPTFTQVSPICSGGTLIALPTTSNNGIAGSWSPALNNTATTTYTFAPTSTASPTCATTKTMIITVNALPTATITAGGATTVCQGVPVVLNSNTGTGLTYQWKNNGTNITGATAASYTANASGSYTVVVTNSNGCLKTSTATIVTVNPSTTPIFTQAVPICSGGTLNTLPTTSNNAISGSWSPALNNNATTTYTFTPTSTVSPTCATPTTMTITVNALPNATITAGGVTTVCPGGSVVMNANTGTGLTYQWSNNGSNISGATASSYTATIAGSYTVVVTNISNCSATSTSTTVTLNPSTTPTFTQVTPICSGEIVNALPTTSNNSIAGSWTPSLNNTVTTTYTFTPTSTTAPSCASSTTMTITVNPLNTPSFTQLAAICSGGSFTLPSSSNENISGTWSPAINNAASTTYTFTPNSGQCANTQSMTVIVDPLTTPTFSQVVAICSGGTISLPSVSNENISGTWSPAINNTVNTTYTFTPNSGQCGNTQTMTVAVNPLPTVTLATFNSVCDTAGLVNLTGGSPAGGTYSGTSVSNNAFNTTIGIGSYPISYSYTNSNGCSSNATQNLLVIACTGSDVIELKDNEIVLYPNPTLDAFTVETSEDLTGKSFIIHDVSGRVLSSGKLVGNKSMIQISLLSSGTYYLNFPETNQTLKFIKQ